MSWELGVAVSEDRLAAAEALRRLGHSLVGRHVEDAVLRRIAQFADEVRIEVDRGEPRARPVGDMKRRLFETAPADGEGMDHFPDCVVSGRANPMGIAIRVHREGEDAVARVTLGSAFEGAPGRAHGGVVSAIFDDTMGFVLTMERTPAFTGRLTVTYRAPTPVGEELEFRARLKNRSGRKLLVLGEANWNGQRVAEAEGLFIVIPIERFGIGAETGGDAVKGSSRS